MDAHHRRSDRGPRGPWTFPLADGNAIRAPAVSIMAPPMSAAVHAEPSTGKIFEYEFVEKEWERRRASPCGPLGPQPAAKDTAVETWGHSGPNRSLRTTAQDAERNHSRTN